MHGSSNIKFTAATFSDT